MTLLQRPHFWITLALTLGLGLRTYYYVSDPPIWHDEAALIVNVLQKNYAEQLGPLYYSEAAPPLFLWLERGIAQTLGDSTLSLRLVPWLASCAGLVLMFMVGRRLLAPWPLFVFLLLFAVSDRLLWHCCEAKPYAIDVLLAVVLLALLTPMQHVPEAQAKDTSRLRFGLVVLTLFAPLAIFLSFPACFMLGGVGLALLGTVWRTRDWRVGLTYVAFGASTCVAFAILYLGPIRAQRDERILDCWSWNFPAWDQPWLVPGQLFIKLTEVSRYACEPLGNVLSVFAVVGAIALWRQRQRRLLGVLLLPTALAAFAWLLGQYPLGPSRVMVFAAPACLLLIAMGLPDAFAWLNDYPRWRLGLAMRLAVIVLIAYPVLQAGYRVVVPWKRTDSATPAAFVLQHRAEDEPVVGTMWEHQYYFRDLGGDYRTLAKESAEPRTPSATAPSQHDTRRSTRAPAIWLVVNRDAGTPEAILAGLPAGRDYAIDRRAEFAGIVVSRATCVVNVNTGAVANLSQVSHSVSE